FFQLGEQRARGLSWEPPVDIFEGADEFCVVVALPGVQAAKLQVAIEDRMVVVSGVRELPLTARSAAIHRLEIPHGRFERRIPLPVGTQRLARYELENGCLVLCLPKEIR